jgi:hypothetical protein
MSRRSIASVFIAGFLLAGCAGMSDTEQRTLSGGAMGAAGGAVVGAIAGNTALGAAIGGAAGLAGGYIWDRHKKSEEEAYERGVKDGQSSQSQ